MMSFAKDRSGNFGLIAALLLPLLIGVAGYAVDLSNTMSEKVRVQNALDAAVLAVSKLSVPDHERQTFFEAAFFANFGAKPGDMTPIVLKMTKDTGFNEAGAGYVSVNAEASASVYTRFMTVLGTDAIHFTVTSGAYEAMANVEISLVLDISSSMDAKKMKELKLSSIQFIKTVLTDEAVKDGRITISLIPYGGTVRLPQEISGSTDLNANENHWEDGVWNGCFQYNVHQFNDDYIGRETLNYVPFFYTWYKNNPWCPKEGNELIPPTADAEKLINTINSFTPSDGTGTDHGALWGLKALSADWQNKFPGSVPDRPLPKGESNNKFMILMTDGGITSQNAPDDYLKGAKKVKTKDVKKNDKSNGNTHHVHNKDNENKGRSKAIFGNNTVYNVSTASSNLSKVCSLAKASDITVYTIGFDVPDDWKMEVLRNCASSLSKYFNVAESKLSEAFSSIVGEMQTVRLTK